MGSAPNHPSVAVGRLLRRSRKKLRMTLREVSEYSEGRGERIPTSTLARIEQGKLDPGVRRLYLLLDLYEIPPALVADLVELEAMAVDPPAEVEGDLETLYVRGLSFWKSGDLGRGLSHLFAVRALVPPDAASALLRQRATLAFATAARNLGKFRLARQLSEALLCEPADPSLTAQVLVLAASAWRGCGSTEIALALVRQAALHVGEGDDQIAAFVLHQEAKLLVETGRADDALPTIDRALERYRDADDRYGEIKALALRTGVYQALERRDEAFADVRLAMRLAVECEHAQLEISVRLQLGRLLVSAGAREDGLAELHTGLRLAEAAQNRKAEFAAHYHLWQVYQDEGDDHRARFELDAARYFVRFIDEHSPEADEVRRHGGLPEPT